MAKTLRHLSLLWSLFLFGSKESICNVFMRRKRCNDMSDLNGKVVVITGANSGIGRETACRLSLRGAKVIIGCRDTQRAENAINYIKSKNPLADIISLKLDLSSLTSVRQFVKIIEENEEKVDILINNAGTIKLPESITEEGFETTFVTNYLGHFLLTLLLMDSLKKSSAARVINVSSVVYKAGKIHFDNIHLQNGAYDWLEVYCQSKLAVVLFTRELAKRLGRDSTVKTYCLHPGSIYNEFIFNKWALFILKPLLKLTLLTAELGSETTVYCAVEDELKNQTGCYYDDCKRVDKLSSNATDNQTAEKLWELSCNLVNINKDVNFK